MKGSYICTRCNTAFASRQSLWNHKQRCEGSQHVPAFIGQKRSSVGDGDEPTKPKNAKIQALVDAIVNDGTKHVGEAEEKRPRHKDDDFVFGFDSMAEAQKAADIANKPSSKDDDFVFGFNNLAEAQKAAKIANKEDIEYDGELSDDDDESSSESTDKGEFLHPPPEVVRELFPRTKEEIMDWCSDESEDDEEESDDEGKIKLLPDTVDGLQKRFKKLYCQFMRHNQHQHRNELVFLLDELLRQDAISRETYTQLNYMLAQSLDGNKDENDDDEEGLVLSGGETREKMIQSTVNYLVAHDKEELMTLLDDFKDEAGEEYVGTLTKLDELVNSFLVDEFLKGEPLLPMIEDLMRELESSHILRSKQHRLKMLLNDIKNNRYRVKSILTRLGDTHNKRDVEHALRQLASEDLLSDEQYEKLMEIEEMDLPMVVDIVKETKVGQGVKFLPRVMDSLKKRLPLLLEEMVETGQTRVRTELEGILEELLRRGGISLKRYQHIKDEHNIL